MILVTGSTGTGKSTTLAAMIDHLNHTRKLNIISLEDPIEFVHRSKNSQVIQRELDTHIPSFAEGVRAAMREDPDVILVGELRDAETIRMAMTAAETGHLVLGTLHTTGAVKTIDRIIDALPVEEREQTKSFLSQSLLAVVTQILVKTADGRGRKAHLRDHGDDQGRSPSSSRPTRPTRSRRQLQMGRDLGMQLLDQALLAAITAREIDPDDAYAYATRQGLFQKFVTDTSMLPKLDFTGAARRRRRRPLRQPERARAWPDIDAFLTEILDKRGSDLHFIAGDPPRIRQLRRPDAAAPGQARRRSSSNRRSTRSCRSPRSIASRRRTAPTSPTPSPTAAAFA